VKLSSSFVVLLEIGSVNVLTVHKALIRLSTWMSALIFACPFVLGEAWLLMINILCYC
jgi:hypothetical protein